MLIRTYFTLFLTLHNSHNVKLYITVRFSKEFDTQSIKKESKEKYIPPLTHPWRAFNVISYFSSQKHRIDGADI